MNKPLAKVLFDTIKANYNPALPIKRSQIKINSEAIITKSLPAELRAYKATLARFQIPDYANKRVGSIVMNCNPFTLGHLYLIEEGLKHVDHLYVFM